jgi:arylsulfatase A-like enzyme
MSFQRPHGPITSAPERFDMHDPDVLALPENAFDFLEHGFSGKPRFMQEKLQDGCVYPLADLDPSRLRRCLASYYALISEIDAEIGRVLDHLDEMGQLEDTVIFYTADHCDFAGEHGLFHKNLGIYDSIHRIPFRLSWPGGPQGATETRLVESVDWYPTLCSLCNVSIPGDIDGKSLIPQPDQDVTVKDAVFCESDNCSAIRTENWRLVVYRNTEEGELYDLASDPGETRNRWDSPDALKARVSLSERLLRFTMGYSRHVGPRAFENSPTQLVQFGRCYWNDLKRAYHTPGIWPPDTCG